jgi:hypothetical protein
MTRALPLTPTRTPPIRPSRIVCRISRSLLRQALHPRRSSPGVRPGPAAREEASSWPRHFPPAPTLLVNWWLCSGVASASDDKVILRGPVRSWAKQREAERVAWSAPGVTAVGNCITIAP